MIKDIIIKKVANINTMVEISIQDLTNKYRSKRDLYDKLNIESKLILRITNLTFCLSESVRTKLPKY